MDTTVNDRSASGLPPRDPAYASKDAARLTRDPESIGALFASLWRHTTTLVQEETELAVAEVSEKATQAMTAAGAIAVGGAVLFAGFIVLLLAAVYALMPLLPPDIAPWLAPAIVGLVVVVIGFVMVSAGLKALKAKSLKPTRTVESLRRDTQMVKEHV